MSQKSSRAARNPSGTSSSRSHQLDGAPPAKKIKTRPMMSIARPPVFDLSSIPSASQPTSQPRDLKGKGKEKAEPTLTIPDEQDHLLWVDKYGPTSEENLAVHKRKVQDVRQWLLEAFGGGPSGKLKKYRRILALTGPAGTAKTATIRVLSGELGYEILEWQNSMDEQFFGTDGLSLGSWDGIEYEGLAEKFQTFLARASSCRPIFTSSQSSTSQSNQLTQDSSISQHTSPSNIRSSPSSASLTASRRQVILLEDLPNILHSATQTSFHAALESFVASPDGGVGPLVIVISDAGIRGENSDEDGPRWRSRGKEAMDIRNVLPPSLLQSPYVTEITFNPIAPTYMRSALKSLLDQHFSSSKAIGTRPAKDALDMIIDTSNGDIRSAIMALQFACTADRAKQKSTKGSKKGAKGRGLPAVVMLEAVTRREQSLALFHLLGKIMYNKRKGDPPAPSASAKDIRRDQEIDARLKDLPKVPPHLKQHERRTSRVDVEMLYADTPIDASLLSLYIHQNYTQYCTTLEECDALVDSLSWVDSSGGETWYQTNPHQFHLVALGTLHALPTPVPRRNQKPFKPAFFDALRRQNDAEDGVRDVQMWLRRLEHIPVAAWSQRDVTLGVGTVLCLGETLGRFAEKVPLSYQLFSKLEFGQGDSQLTEIAEEGNAGLEMLEVEPEGRRPVARAVERAVEPEDEHPAGSYPSDDDIEEW